jgi:CO dehydrogenase maturation factor
LSLSIAVAGKGGSGKTSVAALIIRYLKQRNMRPILAVDADPNANLADSLGFKVNGTVGQILDIFQMEKINIPPGMTKEAYLEYKLNEVIVEGDGLDLLTMGRGEGPECYCYPNLILRKMIDTLSSNYKFVVMDNEAGMEHLSRRTSSNIDELLIVSNHSVKGVRTIAQIQELIADLKLAVRRQWIILNAVPADIDPRVKEELDRLGIKPAVTIPWDEVLYQYDLSLKPLLKMPDSSEAVKAVDSMMNYLFS